MLAEDRPKAFTATQVYIVQDSSLTVVISRMLWLVAVSLVVVMLYPLISSPWVILKVLFFLSLQVHEKDGPGFPRDTQINLAFSSTLAWNFRLPYIPGGSENKNGGNKKKLIWRSHISKRRKRLFICYKWQDLSSLKKEDMKAQRVAVCKEMCSNPSL